MISVSEQAKTVWKYVIGISAVIGLLVFLGINFVNMFSYLSCLGPFAIVSYILWIAVSFIILLMDMSIYWKLLFEAALTIEFSLIYIIGINNYDGSRGRIILGWGIVSLVIHAGLLYLLCFGCYELKGFIINAYVKKRAKRSIGIIDGILSDNSSTENIVNCYLQDTYYLSNFIRLMSVLNKGSNSEHLKNSFLKKNEEDYKKRYGSLIAKVPESYSSVFPKKYEDLLTYSAVSSKHRNDVLQIKEKLENATKIKEVTNIETELNQYLTSQQLLYKKGDAK